MTESYVQVATDGSGKKIRNLSLDVVQADGTISTVCMQVAAVRDAAGNAIDFDRTNTLLISILNELTILRRVVAKVAGDADATLFDDTNATTASPRR